MFLMFMALLVSLIFAGASIAGKILVQHNITPFIIVFTRFSITSLALLPFIKKEDVNKVTKRDIAYFFILGFTGVFLFNVLLFTALQCASPITVNLIGATNPMIALLVSALISHAFPTCKQIVAIICSFIGVSIIVFTDTSSACSINASNHIGEFLALTAVISQVCNTFILKKFKGAFSPIFLSFITGVTGIIFLFPFVITNIWTAFISLNFTLSILLLYIGIIAGAVSLTMYVYTVQNLGPANTNMIVFSMAPVFTVILSLIFLDYVPMFCHLLGGALVLLALIIGLRK